MHELEFEVKRNVKRNVKRINVDIPEDLWERASKQAILMGLTKREYMENALTHLLIGLQQEHRDGKFAGFIKMEGKKKRINMDINKDLWRQAKIEAARYDTDLRIFVINALQGFIVHNSPK